MICCSCKENKKEIHYEKIKGKTGYYCEDCLYQYECYVDAEIEDRKLRFDEK